MKKLFTSVLLAGAGLAPFAVAQDAAQTEGADRPAAAVLSAGTAHAEAVALADAVALVHDTATADAAADKVAALVGKLEGQGGEETFWTRMHMAYADCYGSAALRRAMAPLLPPTDLATNPDFVDSLPLLHDIWQTLKDIRTTLETVQDKAGADAAAEALSLFSRHIDDCLENGNGVPAPKGNRLDLVIYFYSGEYRCTAAVYKAWGELQERSGDYYGSDRFARAVECLCAAMENLDLAADPYKIGRMVELCPQMEELMCRLLDVAASVHDKAGADAAAPLVKEYTAELYALAGAPGHDYEKDFGHVSPRFLFLSLACDRILQKLVRNGYYGSEELEAALEH